jgi:NAD(P)-dependent dehydrogenase (short-subunit alcohol dehydrogenase family)
MADALQGRVALVTGAGRGLGRAYALALARLGCAVVVNSPPREDGASALAVVEEIAATGGRAVPFIGSAADPADAKAAVEAAIAAFGKIDILVINAGVVLNKPFLETTGADLQRMIEVHLTGPFAAVQRAFAPMSAQGWGRIVLTGTGSAAFGLENQSAYASAKASLTGLCNVLKLEASDTGVLVNVVLPVAPPPGRTPASLRIGEMLGARVGRLQPDWVAPLVCLLASDACPGTGGVYSAVGGRYARVFTAVSRGWTAPGREPPSLRDIGDHLDAILDERSYHLPDSILEEIEIAALGG